MKKLIILLGLCLHLSTYAQTFSCISENINPTGSSNPEQLTLFSGWFGADDSIARIWFVADHHTAGKELCVSQGLINNTRLDKDEPNNLDPMIEIVSRTKYGILYNTPGAVNFGLRERKTIGLSSNYGFCTSAAYNGSQFAFGNWQDNGASIGRELYKLNGGGLIKDINPGPNSSDPDFITAVATNVYFAADNGTSGKELWVTKGSASTTVMVKDINLGAGSSNPRNITRVQNTIFFEASTPAYGSELWVSDGTSAGTHMVKDITPGSGSTLIQAITSFQGKAYFNANDGINGKEFWVSDGTDAGTYMVKNISTSGGSNPQGFTSIYNQYLCFSASNGNDGREFYISDGTAAGTKMVKNINQFPNAGSGPYAFTAYNGKVYFYADDGTNDGRELYESDFTAAGTKVIQPPIQTTSDPCFSSREMVAFKGLLFFTANYDTRGNELWTLKTAVPTATKNVSMTNNIIIYPNPTAELLHIESEEKITAINVLDMSGKLLLHQKEKTERVDISGLSPGLYLVQILTKEGIVNRKIQKK